ncbi:Hypothetical predicted protein [Mytilus galloprovincialis]|uniref:Reverse transcriptase RNase H-like domain-containing protein n=1 Tax=Mytilus galloprovincialis TaxID=29158 RepID=A0A8B6HPM3_MYTGA|nr:Hypothetical predicted protein [Mytilus galloprovincialis]
MLRWRKSLSASEKNYGISEKECLALVYGIKHFDCYLRHIKFEAFVDHSSLKWLLTMNEPVGKFPLWNALVQSYDFDIKYRPGKIHTDGISTRTYDDEVDQSDNCDELPTFDCISQPIKDTQRRAELTNDAAKELTIVTCAAVVTEKEENIVLSNDSIRDYQRIDT